LKKIILLALVMFGAGNFLFAQEAGKEKENAAASSDPADPVVPPEAESLQKKRWFEYFEGLSLGFDTGTHEYPLAEWYPGQYIEGYSIRSFYIMPYIAYNKVFPDFTMTYKLEATMDFGAADPAPGTTAFNAETADRKDWYTLYFEENFIYALSHSFTKVNFPGTLSLFLNFENYVYLAPEFPAIPGIRDQKGRIADGLLEFGPAYDNDFKWGGFHAKLGIPFTYADRFRKDLGLGMNMTLGYNDPKGLGLAGSIRSEVAFLPNVQYAETEFIFSYAWKDFTVELDITADGAFESALIKPELQYHFDWFTFTMGMEVSRVGVRESAAFSPYFGFDWSY
jgi:hypothetical protein